MALTYNIEEDLRYKQGREESAKETILEMFQDRFPVDKIAKYARVSIDFVKEVI
ncbi:hypothetical protein ACE193_10985 [Bernardetia sp. OM2101]|uniref:hypothetical protein n=1 Tax=Bernardetia sp. OM2101 TaxID=3344876 RepID=UPI0035CEE81D